MADPRIGDMLLDPAGATCRAQYDAGNDSNAASCYNATTVGRGQVPVPELYNWAWREDVWTKWTMAAVPPASETPDATADWGAQTNAFLVYRAAKAVVDLINRALSGEGGAIQTLDLDDPDMTNKLQKLVQEDVMTTAERDELLALADDKLTLSVQYLERDVTAQELGEYRTEHPGGPVPSQP